MTKSTRVVVKEVAQKVGRAPSAMGFLLVDDERLLVEHVMKPAERSDAFVSAVTVEVTHLGHSRPVAEFVLVVDPDRGAPAFAVVAAIESASGAAATLLDRRDVEQAIPESAGPTLYRPGRWRDFMEGDRPRGLAPHRPFFQFTFTQAMPPSTTFGVAHPQQAIKTLEGGLSEIGCVFDTAALADVIEDRRSFVETRIASAMAHAGGNIEFAQVQVAQDIEGRERRLGEMIVSFDDFGGMRQARALLHGICQIFDLKRGLRWPI